MTALTAFSRSIGFLSPVSNRGARLRHRQQVSRILYGFIAKTGKLIPIKEPVEMNLEMRNLMIFGCWLFFSSLMNRSPPSSVSLFQSAVLQKLQYSITYFSAYFFATLVSYNQAYLFSSYFLVFSAMIISSFDLNSFCWLRMAFILAWQLITFGFCNFCYGTSLQFWKYCHSLQMSISLLSLFGAALISQVRLSSWILTNSSFYCLTTEPMERA